MRAPNDAAASPLAFGRRSLVLLHSGAAVLLFSRHCSPDTTALLSPLARLNKPWG